MMASPVPGDSDCLHPGLAEPRTKEDWFAYVFYDPPPRPVLPPYDSYVTMDEAEQRRLNRSRNRYHSALVLAWTPAVQHFETEITELLAANEMAPPGARLGLLIDGPPTVGKSTLVKMIGRKFEQELREDFPERFSPDRLGCYVPVVYISLTDQVTPKQISIAIARYLNVPTSGTKDTIDDRVLTALTASGTQLIIFDDLHFLDCSLKEGRASNDHIKFLANHAPCTIIGTGVDLEESPSSAREVPPGPSNGPPASKPLPVAPGPKPPAGSAARNSAHLPSTAKRESCSGSVSSTHWKRRWLCISTRTRA